MWELIKNNPIIKIVLVLIVGIIGFGILFNVVFGVGYGSYNMGHEGGAYAGYGGMNSTTGVLVYLYSVIFKLLIFALVIAIVATAIRLFYKFTSGTSDSLLKAPLSDPYIKTTTVLGISVVALLIATPILSALLGINLNQGFGGYGGRMINGYGYMHNQYGYNGFNFNELIALVLKIFLILSVLGVLLGLVMFFLKNYSGLLSTQTEPNKCSNCGNKIDKTVKYCPNCGQKQTDADLNKHDENTATQGSKTKKANETSNTGSIEDKNKSNPDIQSGSKPTT